MFIPNENTINDIISSAKKPTDQLISKILKKASKKKGLSLDEVAILLKISKKYLNLLFDASSRVKNEIYGNRIVLFAPLYLSNYCINNCAYCGFRYSNKIIVRKKLSMEEITEQARNIINIGHKRILLETGEHPETSIDYICDAIRTIYDTSKRIKKGGIRRINVNIAATSLENYRKLKEMRIGTYQLFQETYHRKTYGKLHFGPKADYIRQISAHERAFKAGIDDYGMGILFGLYDYRFEIIALLSHIHYMEKKYGVGPHTLSVPRIRPAPGIVFKQTHPISNLDFLKIIAILRLTVPYTGMIISTRETPEIRSKAFKIGISQTSAASATSPGGYSTQTKKFWLSIQNQQSFKEENSSQFIISDERDVDTVVRSMMSDGHIPSFCTACYRSNRTGDRFMKLAKTGNIQYLCRPNAILTLKEYLIDYASTQTRKKGESLIEHELAKIENNGRKKETRKRLLHIEQGKRDIFF